MHKEYHTNKKKYGRLLQKTKKTQSCNVCWSDYLSPFLSADSSELEYRSTSFTDIVGYGYYLRTKAVIIPPAMSPTTLAVRPIPIKPSAFNHINNH